MSQAALAQRLPAPKRKSLSTFELWGRLLVLPYLLVFVIFVLYPVGYGLDATGRLLGPPACSP